MNQHAIAARQEFLRDIAICAVEGGIGYWSSCKRYRWSHDAKGDLDNMLPFPEVVLVPSEDPDDFPQTTLTAETIEKGIAAIIANRDLINATNRKAILVANADNDACQIDADAADCIVQIGMFGKLVFG